MSESELKTPHEHAAENGQLAFVLKPGQEPPADLNRYKWQHLIADRIHGWSLHDYNYEQNPFKLTSAAYLAALGLAESGALHAHEDALPDSRTATPTEPVAQTHVHGKPIAPAVVAKEETEVESASSGDEVKESN